MNAALTNAAVPGTTASTHWVHNLHPVALDLGFLELRWYSLAYLAGLVLGWMFLLRLLGKPGAPMARRHADDFIFYVTLGVILGGRLGYVLFYNFAYYVEHPIDVVKLWDGGMSFHGGLIGSVIAAFYLARRNGLSFLRVGDYACMCAPFGLFFGRLANFVNGELWGHPTNVAWAVRFREVQEGFLIVGPPRHPTQLYEAALEGVVLFLILWAAFTFTKARYKPGLLAGIFFLGYGISRFIVEFFRMPDAHLVTFAQQSGMTMGQWLTIPMILLGLFLIVTSARRAVMSLPPEPETATS